MGEAILALFAMFIFCLAVAWVLLVFAPNDLFYWLFAMGIGFFPAGMLFTINAQDTYRWYFVLPASHFEDFFDATPPASVQNLYFAELDTIGSVDIEFEIDTVEMNDLLERMDFKEVEVDSADELHDGFYVFDTENMPLQRAMFYSRPYTGDDRIDVRIHKSSRWVFARRVWLMND